MSLLRDVLHLAGKTNRKVIAVFGVTGDDCAPAIRHLQAGAPAVPVWLFATRAPSPETAVLCERVVVIDDSMALLVEAQKQLWSRWVALSAATWTGAHGAWPLKLAPFLVPPFRALLMNENEGFFPGRPRDVSRHAGRRIRDAVHSSWNRSRDLNRGAWLWLFAIVAQRFTFLSRWAFRRWHGSESLVVPDVTERGSSIERISYYPRQWQWADVRHRVLVSEARWLLFDSTGAAPAPIDDLLMPFADARTFAVSVQADFRDWKEGLFATAPFRPLQPGEASQTLAPVSPLIVVSRAKLAALDLPKTVVPGAAWLLLFWKAAAAGWRSYSVGRERVQPLDESPDWPYEEAEFVTRVFSDFSVRELGPREPCLARGSIAFLPGPRATETGQPRVLVVSPYLPFPLSHGGAVRIFNLCRALASRVELVLACFREKNERIEYGRLREVFDEVYVVDRDEKAARDETLPRQVREHRSASMHALVRELCRDGRIDVMQVEFTHLADLRDAAPEVPAILVEHDLTFTLYRQFAEQNPTRAARAEYERWLAFERKWLARYDTVWAMSDDDRDGAIAEGAPREATRVVPNGVDLERFVPQPPPDHSAPEVFYVGSFRHHPNVLGFEKLRLDVMPQVWNRFPEARLRVVAGPDYERYWRAESVDPRIMLHGFVEDLRPLYRQSSAIVAPLVVSAGTNIKVMEAMACGRAVVSTPVGCQGLRLVDGEDALIRERWDDFAAAVCTLLKEAGLRDRVGTAARRTVERRFGWDAIAAEAYASYCQLRRASVP